MRPTKDMALKLAAGTIVGMPLIGWAIMWFFQDTDFVSHFRGAKPFWQQIIVGLFVGTVSALGAIAMMRLPFLAEANIQYSQLLQNLKLTTSEKVYISICAGIGEEFLFRGVIQPLLGVFLTAFLFVALHGYLRLTDWRISIYGLYMIAVVVVFGFLTVYLGLAAAAVAHIAVDVILLIGLKPNQDTEDNNQLNESTANYEEEE